MPAYEAPLIAREEIAEGTMLFSFAKPSGFRFRAGQAMRVTLVDPPETDGKGDSRTFSIASAPFENALRVATRMRDTAFKRVLRSMAPGTAVKIRGPVGTFTLEDDDRPAVFLAAGIGITPFVSILRQAIRDEPSRRRVLVYSSRRPEDAAYLGELQRMQSRHPEFRLVATMTGMESSRAPWQGERGRIDREMLRRAAGDAVSPRYYIAGPPAMVAALAALLAEGGVGAGDIRTDEFYGY